MQQHAVVVWFHAPLVIMGSPSAFETARLNDIESAAKVLFWRTSDLLKSKDPNFNSTTHGFLKAYSEKPESYTNKAASIILAKTDHKGVEIASEPNFHPQWDETQTAKKTWEQFHTVYLRSLESQERTQRGKKKVSRWLDRFRPEMSLTEWLSLQPELRYLMGRWQLLMRAHILQEAKRINTGFYPGYEYGQSFALLCTVPFGLPYEPIYRHSLNDYTAAPYGAYMYAYKIATDNVTLVQAERHGNLAHQGHIPPLVVSNV